MLEEDTARMKSRTTYLTLAVVTMVWTLGGCEGHGAAREAQAQLERWASGRLGAAAVAAARPVAQPTPHVGAEMLLSVEEPREVPAALAGSASSAGAPPAAPLAGDGVAAPLPLAVPQPIPTPSRPSDSPPFLAQSLLPAAQTLRWRGSDPLTALRSLRTLPGASYEADLHIVPDGGDPIRLTLLLEYASDPPAQHLRLMSTGADGRETVRLEEVQIGRVWYSYSGGEEGVWARQQVESSERLGSLAWLLYPSAVVDDVGRQDLGIDPERGEHARHLRYGLAAIRKEWLQSMDLPDLESVTVDIWVDEETNVLLGLEVDGRCLTYAGKVSVRASGTLRETGADVQIQRPDLCVETRLPPDVPILPGVEAATHACNAWMYTVGGTAREAAIAHQEALGAAGWRYVEDESYYPDYLVFRKGLRSVVVRIDGHAEEAYAILTVIAPTP
jgi:hypothetical protein